MPWFARWLRARLRRNRGVQMLGEGEPTGGAGRGRLEHRAEAHPLR